MKRAWFYARYSSDLQSPNSNADQFRVCESFVESKGWSETARFQDAALSGATDHRPGYQAMLAAAFQTPTPCDVIVVESLDRLTRDSAELTRLYQRLRLKGIDLVGVSDGIDTSRAGAMVHVGLKGLMSAVFLEDLAAKTHRGLAGRVARGLSPGGRIYGFRSVVDGFEIEPIEAAVVRLIFREYANGQSMTKIAHALNREGVPFPTAATKRGQARLGWGPPTIHRMLRNERYTGSWTWNRTRFLKDPVSGRRRPVPRPKEEWTTQERPDLRIVESALWSAVQARLAQFERADAGPYRSPKGGARQLYSPHLLSGLLRCGPCNSAMIIQSATRKDGQRAGWYVCGAARAKGVCSHVTYYRQERLEAALIGKFREATTPAMITELVRLVNAKIDEALRERARRVQDIDASSISAERQALERARANYIIFIADGDHSPAVRAQLRAAEDRLEALRVKLAELEPLSRPPSVHRAWVERRLEHLDELLRADPLRARAEIAKHLAGPLVVTPRPSPAGVHQAEVIGNVAADSLFGELRALPLVIASGGLQSPKSNTLAFEADLV